MKGSMTVTNALLHQPSIAAYLALYRNEVQYQGSVDRPNLQFRCTYRFLTGMSNEFSMLMIRIVCVWVVFAAIGIIFTVESEYRAAYGNSAYIHNEFSFGCQRLSIQFTSVLHSEQIRRVWQKVFNREKVLCKYRSEE